MAITFGTPADLNIDETGGVAQGTPIDESGARAALLAETAYSYLLPPGDPGTFPQVAYDANFITSTVTGGTVVSDLIFTHEDPSQPTKQVAFSTSDGYETALKDIDGHTIYLFLDGRQSANGNVLLGRTANDASAPVAFAIVLDEATNHQSAGAYIVLYKAMEHNLDGADPNDVIDLTNKLFVSAASTTTTTSTFSDFGDVPSGNTDFAIIAPDSATPGTSGAAQLLVTGQVAVTSKGPNPVTTQQDTTVNVSTQGLGSGSQAVGEKATLQIDFITGGTQDTGSFSEIAYTNHVEGITETSFVLTQVNPNGTTVNLTVAGWNDTSDATPNGAKPGAATNVTLTGVQVFDANGNPAAGVTKSIDANGDAVITGLELGDKIVVTSAGMDRISISNKGPNKNSSFDVGVIKFATTTTTVGTENIEAGSHVKMFDDGPSIDPAATPPTLQVDDSTFGTDDTEALANFFTNVSGGSDTATTAYSLAIKNSTTGTGLFDTATNTEIHLFKTGNTVEGRAGTTAASPLIFTLSISGADLVLDQRLAIKHIDTGQNDESTSISSVLSDLITLTGTITDKDNDPDSATVNIADKLSFLDDGPALTEVNTGGSVAFVSGQHLTDAYLSSTGGDLGDGVIIASFTNDPVLTATQSADKKTVTYSDGTGDLFKMVVTDSGYDFSVLRTQQNSTSALDFGAIASGGPTEIIDVPTVDNPNVKVRFDGLIVTNDSDPRLAVNNPGAASTNDDANPDSLGFGIKGGQASQFNNNEGFSAELLGGELAAFTFEIQAIGSVKSVNVTYWTVSDNPVAGGQPVLSGPTLVEVKNLPSGSNTVVFDDIVIPQEGADKIFVEFEFLDKFGNPDTNAGVRVLNFKETQTSTFNPYNLDFTLSNTDKDGDAVTSNNIHITVDPTLIV